jgi:hypothetical protein
MTFFFIRAGLPNTIVILALALVPFVSFALGALPENSEPPQASSVTLLLQVVTVVDCPYSTD